MLSLVDTRHRSDRIGQLLLQHRDVSYFCLHAEEWMGWVYLYQLCLNCLFIGITHWIKCPLMAFEPGIVCSHLLSAERVVYLQHKTPSTQNFIQHRDKRRLYRWTYHSQKRVFVCRCTLLRSQMTSVHQAIGLMEAIACSQWSLRTSMSPRVLHARRNNQTR